MTHLNAKHPFMHLLKFGPPFPLKPEQWARVSEKMRLSPRQARIVELVLRDLSTKQIAYVMGIGEPTIKTHLERIGVRTRTRGRIQLAMRVMEISHDRRRQS